MWDMHNRTTEEQARANRGRSDDGTNIEMEAAATTHDVGDNHYVLQHRKLVHFIGFTNN